MFSSTITIFFVFLLSIGIGNGSLTSNERLERAGDLLLRQAEEGSRITRKLAADIVNVSNVLMEMREQLKTVEMNKEHLHKQFDDNKMHMVTLQNKWNEAKRIQKDLQMKRRRLEEDHESGKDSDQNEYLLRMLRVEYSRALADDRLFSSKQEQLSQEMHQLSTQLRDIGHSSRMMDARVKSREQILSDIRLQLRNQLIANRQMMEIATSSQRLYSFIRSNVHPSSIRESAEMLLDIIKHNQPILIEKTLIDEIENITTEILDQYNNNIH